MIFLTILARSHTRIDLGASGPFQQRPWHAADLRGNHSTAAHSDGYSPRRSCASRTARSRTSGENLFELFMAPFSQELEPPQNPGRFMEWGQSEIGKGRQASGRFSNWRPKATEPGRFVSRMGWIAPAQAGRDVLADGLRRGRPNRRIDALQGRGVTIWLGLRTRVRFRALHQLQGPG